MKISTYPVGFKMTCYFHLSKATNCKMKAEKGMIIINRTRCTGKKQKKEKGNRSHFSKAIQRATRNQGLQVPPPWQADSQVGLQSLFLLLEGSASSLETGHKCPLLAGRCTTLPGTERSLPEWKEKHFTLSTSSHKAWSSGRPSDLRQKNFIHFATCSLICKLDPIELNFWD